MFLYVWACTCELIFGGEHLGLNIYSSLDMFEYGGLDIYVSLDIYVPMSMI